jgi:hypothetical protein
MPTVFTKDGIRVYFYSADWHEPIHVHVECAQGEAKFWLDPIVLASSHRMKANDLRRARRLIEANASLIREKWNEYFGAKS